MFPKNAWYVACIPAPRSRLPSLLSCPLGEGRP